MLSDKTRDAWRLLRIFLRLGMTSFGGPVAHLALFRREFVSRRNWISEERYAELVALCQALPGPSSSQVALLVGRSQGGLWGAFLAWLGFTLPGAVLMTCAAIWVGQVGSATSWIHGFKVFAVAVVAHALWGMAKALAPDFSRGSIALIAAGICLVVGKGTGQLAAIACGGCLGGLLPALPDPEVDAKPMTRRREALFLVGFFGLLSFALWVGNVHGLMALAMGMVRAGSLVFGGGHVVLPLLRTEVVDQLSLTESVFLAGYGLAQGMPGPLFNIAAWLGASFAGWKGALIATVSIFLPGILVAIGTQPLWDRLRRIGAFQRALRGINAAVVGILLSALFFHVLPAGIKTYPDALIGGSALAALFFTRLPPWGIALGCAVLGMGF